MADGRFIAVAEFCVTYLIANRFGDNREIGKVLSSFLEVGMVPRIRFKGERAGTQGAEKGGVIAQVRAHIQEVPFSGKGLQIGGQDIFRVPVHVGVSDEDVGSEKLVMRKRERVACRELDRLGSPPHAPEQAFADIVEDADFFGEL